MVCWQCGQETKDGSTQCSHCGAVLLASPPALRTSGLAIASLVFSLTCIGALPAIILGIISLRQISRRNGELAGKGLAIAGLCISGAAMFLLLPMLAAMLFPVFAQARAAAKKSQCLANVKNIAIGLNMYAADYGEFPAASVPWSSSVEEYVKNRDVFVCPDQADAKGPEKAHRSGFAFNISLRARSLDGLPQSMVSVFESDAGWNAKGGRRFLAKQPRHLRGDNYGFADGHAKWFPRQAALDPATLVWTAPKEPE